MSFKDLLPEGLKHALLTEDDPALKPVEQQPPLKPMRSAQPALNHQLSTPTQLYHPSIAAPPIVGIGSIQQPNATYPTLDTGDNTFAQTLKAKTNFDTTDIGKQVAHEMKPLEGIASLTESDKINIALKAGAEEGLTAEKIIATFDSLLQTLESENSGFQTAVAAATQSGPEAIKSQIQAEADKIVDLEAQITAARAKQSDLSTELIKASTKIQTNTMQFNAAYEARKSELTSAKSHYQSILQGIR